MTQPREKLGRLTTGIAGLDKVLNGGLPELSNNIIFGLPGAGKTIFTYQFLNANASENRRALFLTTLSEPALKLLHHLNKFTFVDQSKIGSSIIHIDITEIIRTKGVGDTVAFIMDLVRQHKPEIVAIDSFKAIHDLAQGTVEVRNFGYDLAAQMTAWGITLLCVGEYNREQVEREPIFAIADGIIQLHNVQHGLHYERYVDVLKMRGGGYANGLHPFTISDDGLTVFPRIRTMSASAGFEMTDERLSVGLPEMDAMLEGGLPRGTTTMVAGSAGTGKTLLGLHFIVAGVAQNEPGVIVTFQENPNQLNHIAGTFGWDLNAMEKQGLLCQLYSSPVEIQPDIHFTHVRAMAERIGARRVLIDSIKDVEIAIPNKVRYRDYLYSLVSEFKQKGITCVITNEIPELFGPFQLSEFGVSFIADNVILLRYVESNSRMGRAINVLKVRGSHHSKAIWEYEITNAGMRILEPMQATTGVLTGSPVGRTDNSVSSLSLRTRYILDTLRGSGLTGLEDLGRMTAMDTRELMGDLQDLREQGLVIAINKSGGASPLFKSTL